MKTTRLALVDTPPVSAEAVARMIAAAKAGGRALAFANADSLDAMAEQLAELAKAGDAVSPGVRELAARLAVSLPFSAANIRDLA